jgi:hypothetical protein
MKQFELLSSFSKEEFKRFIEFANSPFFNKRKDLSILTESLYEKFPKVSMSDEEIYLKVYGTGKFNRQVTRNLLSRLGELLEKFLTQLGIEKEKTFSNVSLANELGKRGKAQRANKVISMGIDELEKETYSVEYLKKYYEYLETVEAVAPGTESYRVKLENSVKRGECAVNYFLLSLLRIANDYAVFKHVHRFEDKTEIFNGFMEYFDFERYIENMRQNGSQYYAITAIFYYGLLCKYNDPESEYREKLKELVFANLDKLKIKDQYTCWIMLFASYIFTNTVQKKPVNKELHGINKVFVGKNLIPKDDSGYVIASNYHNIAYQAIISKDFEWALNFLNEYKEKIEPSNRENMYCVLMAACLFGKGEFEECINFLSKAKVDNVMTKLIIRTNYIKCYYELGYFDEAESAIDAMRMFMYQNKELTPQVKRSIPDFIKYSRLLVKAKAGDLKIPEGVYLKAQKTPGFNSRSWVLEKMKELQ